MNRLPILMSSVLMVFLTGCFAVSLNPLDGGGASRVKDSSMIGTWTSKCPGLSGKTCKAVIAAGKDSELSIEYWDEDGKATPLRGVVVAIGAERFLDLSIADIADKQSRLIPVAILAHMAPVHSIWKVRAAEGFISITPMKGEALAPFAGRGIQLSDPWHYPETSLITSSSSELGAFLKARHNEIFTGETQTWKPAKAE